MVVVPYKLQPHIHTIRS